MPTPTSEGSATYDITASLNPNGVTTSLSVANVTNINGTNTIVGTPGPSGNAGPPGSPGPANSLSIGTVTTLPPGSSATATITGSSPTQTLSLGLPTGDAGSTGATGPAGQGVPTGGSAGQVLTKNSSTDYDTVWATGGGGGGGGGGITWNNITTSTQAATADNGYIANDTVLVTITLPSTAAIGSVVEVAGAGTGGWKIAQGTGQQIFFGTSSTTSGTGGSLASSNQYDAVRLLCIVANTTFSVISSQGNITVV